MRSKPSAREQFQLRVQSPAESTTPSPAMGRLLQLSEGEGGVPWEETLTMSGGVPQKRTTRCGSREWRAEYPTHPAGLEGRGVPPHQAAKTACPSGTGAQVCLSIRRGQRRWLRAATAAGDGAGRVVAMPQDKSQTLPPRNHVGEPAT